LFELLFVDCVGDGGYHRVFQEYFSGEVAVGNFEVYLIAIFYKFGDCSYLRVLVAAFLSRDWLLWVQEPTRNYCHLEDDREIGL